MQAAFQYESDKSPRLGDRARDWRRDCSGRARLDAPDECRSAGRAPPRVRPAVVCDQLHESKPNVPLKVWVLASASCFAVCAALVLATVAVTKWGSLTTELYDPPPAPPRPAHSQHQSPKKHHSAAEKSAQNGQDSNEIHNSILEKLSMFKNFINRDAKKDIKKDTLVHRAQFHPEFDPSVNHPERKIEKKDQAKTTRNGTEIPEFKPTLPDIFVNRTDIRLPDGYVEGLRKYDLDYYNNDMFYQDDPLYDDYAQSNSMTSYLIEKIQELYEWVTTDPELEGVKNSTERIFSKKGENGTHNELGQLLQALNESVVEGNVSIVMLKLKEIYFGGENFTNLKATHRTILRNTTDLLSFGMLTLDVMLLHNIQIMAWDSQESSGPKMLQDPEVFAFNALFMEPTKIEAKRQEVMSYREGPVAHARRQEAEDETSLGRGLLEGVLELGLSAARAAVHLGRAYKNAKSTMRKGSNQEAGLQSHLARNSDSNAHALNHLRASYDREDAHGGRVTELDCVWFLYCRNLVATAKLPAPFGTMARINGVALRMIAGELVAEKALDTLVVEAMTGWTELRCPQLLPRCSHGEAAVVVLESMTQPHRKAHGDHKPSM